MKIDFLGTNGWYDTDTGNTTCVLIETNSEFIIFDAGNGFSKIDRYINGLKPVYLFLSHFHLDHIIGLHILNKFRFKQSMNIYGPAGLKRMFAMVINKPYSIPISSLKYNIKLIEIGRGTKFPVATQYANLKHSSLCYGYRLTLEEKVVTFCTDTGTCKNLSLLAKHADLLLLECSLKSGRQSHKWPHLNPEMAASVAKAAGAKRLGLIHFDAYAYQSIPERIFARNCARNIFKNTFVAKDNFTITI